jgi:hypothetical protein
MKDLRPAGNRLPFRSPALASLPALLAFAVVAVVAPIAAAPTPAHAQSGGSALDRKSSGALPAPEARILVDGDPPLTEAMVERIAKFVTFCFEIPLTPADREHFRTILTGEWRRSDRASIAGDLEMLKTAEQLAALPPAKRELFRQMTLSDGLADARKRAKTDPDMRWLVSRYEQEHRPLAGAGSGAGTLALTRQAADAFAELACFMASEARGETLTPDRPFKDDVARTLIGKWPSLDAEGRKQIASMPLILAQLRAAWPDAPPAQKEEARAQWRRQFGSATVAQAATPAAGGGSGKTAKPGASGSRTQQLMKKWGIDGLKASDALLHEQHKHLGMYMILSNPTFYH